MSVRGLVRMSSFGIALLVSLPAVAEPKVDDKRAEVRSRMRGLMGKLLRQDVGLDEKTARGVEQTLDQFKAERQRLRAELRSQRQKLRELLRQNSEDQRAYEQAVNELREAQKKLHGLRERELDAVGKQLTPKQQAKFLQALQRLQRRLNKALERYDGQPD